MDSLKKYLPTILLVAGAVCLLIAVVIAVVTFTGWSAVHKKFSAKFATEVQWQKVDANGNEVSDDEEDITQNNDGPTPDPNEGGENEE